MRKRAMVGVVCALAALGGALGGCARPTDRELAYGSKPDPRKGWFPRGSGATGGAASNAGAQHWQQMQLLRELSRSGRR